MALNFYPPPQPYQGFVGSEATRFYQQHTTDIHFTDYHPPALNPKIRQAAYAVGQGLTFVSPEVRVGPFQPDPTNPYWPLFETWQHYPVHCWQMHVRTLGPSQPGWLPPWPHPVMEPISWGLVAGAWRIGFYVRWFYEVQEWQLDPQNAPTELYYFEHKARREGEHHITLPIKRNGKYFCFDTLSFGTQLQIYRRAQLDD